MSLNVLIVDDSAPIRKILERVLRHANLALGDVQEAGDGHQALAKLASQPSGHQIGLVISEINMPNMDGLELLAALKSDDRWKALPVVMVTTEGGQEKVIQAIQLGAAGYIRKPFTAEQINEKLSGIV